MSPQTWQPLQICLLLSDMNITEKYMNLPSHTTGEAIFETLNEFMVSSEIKRTKCVVLSTDGARAMVGKLCGECEACQGCSLAGYSCSLQSSLRGTGHKDYACRLKDGFG